MKPKLNDSTAAGVSHNLAKPTQPAAKLYFAALLEFAKLLRRMLQSFETFNNYEPLRRHISLMVIEADTVIELLNREQKTKGG